MAYNYRRRRYGRYRRSRRRRYATNRRRYARVQKSPYTKVHLAKRLGSGFNAQASNEGEPITQILNDGQPIQVTFRLNDVVNYTEFTQLYNEYKIRAVKISLIPLANVSNMQSSAYSHLIHTAIDINGLASSQLTRDNIRQYSTVRWSPYNRIHSRYFFPRMRVDSRSNLSPGTVTMSGKQPWSNISYSTNNYYSLLISPPTIPDIDSDDPIYTLEVMYYMSFRGTR